MNKVLSIFSFFLLLPFALSGQTRDSIATLEELSLDAFQRPISKLTSTKSFALTTPLLMAQNPGDRLLESLNLLPGVSMEQRSPGSYRLALRGSSLRSPFGVRNVKIYLDEFSLTEASGGSSLNLIDPSFIRSMALYKGPEAGDFGATTGGTAILHTKADNSLGLSLGSYGAFSQSLSLSSTVGKHTLTLLQGYSRADNYREQSAFSRASVLLKDRIAYKEGRELGLLLLLADLDYQTPGGLTKAQALENPQSARLPTPTLPSAKAQNAGIQTKAALFGISHKARLSPSLSHFALVQGGYSDLKNPFITNFEKRYERQFTLRSYLSYESKQAHWAYVGRLGIEGSSNQTNVQNYDNLGGHAGEKQNFDNLSALSGFGFSSHKLTYKNSLVLEGAVSLNFLKLGWQALYPGLEEGQKVVSPELLPSLSALYHFNSTLALRAKLSRGSSSPTLEELRSSDQQINFSLISESGWNKELGLRKAFGPRVFVDLTYFEFDLKNAIVKAQNEKGEDYFLNQGGAKQKGLEFALEAGPFSLGALNQIRFYGSGSLYDFTLTNSALATETLADKEIPGVPSTSVSALLSLRVMETFGVQFTNYYRSSMYLDSKNMQGEKSSLVGQLRLSAPFRLEQSKGEVYFSLVNLYRTTQSLGYDLNAFGGRYYNPAPPSAFHLGLKVLF